MEDKCKGKKHTMSKNDLSTQKEKLWLKASANVKWETADGEQNLNFLWLRWSTNWIFFKDGYSPAFNFVDMLRFCWMSTIFNLLLKIFVLFVFQ